MYNIKIVGIAGQGVKLLSTILGKILDKEGYHVTVLVDYGATVRGDRIVGYVRFSKSKIESPLFEEPDLLIELTKSGEKAKEVFNNIDGKTFEEFAISRFGDRIYANMVVLGGILAKLNIGINEDFLLKVLPKKNVEKNLEAVKQGYLLFSSL